MTEKIIAEDQKNIIMKRIVVKKFIRNGRFSYSLFFFFSAVLLITMVFVTFFFVSQYRTAYSELTGNYSKSVIDRLTFEIDGYLQTAEELSAYPYIYKEWREQMESRDHYPLGSLDIINMINLKEFDSSLTQMSNSAVDYDAVYLFCENGQLLYSASLLPPQAILTLCEAHAYKQTDWYKKTVEKDGSALFLRADLVDSHVKDVFYVTRLIKNTVSRKEIGVYMIEVNVRSMDNICNPYIDLENERCVVLDKDSHIIYSSGKAFELPDNLIPENGQERAESTCVIGDTNYYIISERSSRYDYTVARFVPMSVLDRARHVTVYSIILFVVSITLFAILLFFMLSRTLSRPVTELAEKVVKEELEKKEAQIIALRRQINPHFLYNTLDSIQLVAITNRDFQASRMITSLGKLLRYAISDDEYATIEEEMDYINDYLSLLEIRYKNSFVFETDIPQELLSYPIIRLTLQPIVENCIQHGLRGTENGKITLSASVTEQGYIIQIKDNGKGIDEQTLSQVREKLGNESTGHTSIGIYNVNSRLKKHYGEKSGLMIDSVLNEGTTVTLTIELNRDIT